MIFIAGVGILIGLVLQKPGGDDATRNPSDQFPKSTQKPFTSPADPEPQQIAAAELGTSKDEIYELTALRELLQKEVQARKELQAQLSEVTTRLDSLESAQTSEPTSPQTQNTTTIRTTNNRQGVNRPGWINTQALLAAGLDEFQANKIRDIYENVEMERLYLRDRAVREGWIGDERYRQEREQLDARLETLRDELSDKEYDAYLFATGRPNRVIIESTLRTSPARDAGIKTGDSVIRYNNIRVYTWADLRNATTQCPTDSMVEVELERNGQRQRAFVPCGPLGVRLDNTSVQP
jgi:hypothetical protein